MIIDAKTAYNELPLLPPDNGIFDDPEILKASMSAAASAASLNATIKADLSNVIHSLNMMSPLYVPEAVTSSGVENIVTTNERVYESRLLEDKELTAQDKEVMRYVEALEKATELLRQHGFLSTNHYIEIQKTLEPSRGGVRRIPGTQLANPKTGVVYYTPPDSEKAILNLLRNFERYFNDVAPKHEVFIRAAMLHYQFESIHPFHDGNGRTGRILIPLYLTAQGVLDGPLLFVSKYILENRDAYYSLLRGVTFEGNWKQWVLFMLRAIEQQSDYTLAVLQKIKLFKDKLSKNLNELVGHGYATDIAVFLYEHPFFVQSELESALGVSYVTVRKYLRILEEGGVIVKKKQPARNRYIYACPQYINLLKRS